ncbi:MAG: dihydroorotate dehydrogenase electron transfer subunit [Solobacterium sp.]|jgi:dihydroorotate dehydrogenase electron transfer subunit|nr:dihydroorotate dehydrogenase electron transfer subunit [Solobacterium sp.]MCH4048816.1 dihydroorotate dehydrogenase electron transfer subunit [Solobacterium sp.]MCH4074430.1 dihydroorotate dehydrogenase electron transfer subunit [Solobacterium sp.]MCI1314058.1 dihydroorotate dehydrogenase electron transfer subunit [Solobacterium sp.]MCI1346142.1 dihydroorotate dehydrogenase electron transfer subunit [Solobacterium sp.]
MRQETDEILSNRNIARGVYEMKLKADTDDIHPGQFVDIALPGKYLRRPISVCQAENGVLTLIYKTVGRGTEQMSRMQAGEKLDVLLPLGNGYDLTKAGEQPLLVGGGVGVPPLYMLAEKLSRKSHVTVILGFNAKDEIFYEEEFRRLGCDVIVCTSDGSYGIKGFVTDGLKTVKQYSYVYACGPAVMLKNMDGMLESDGEYSMEERMGCGFGVCLGCTIVTKKGPKRVCADGPVFDRKVLVW